MWSEVEADTRKFSNDLGEQVYRGYCLLHPARKFKMSDARICGQYTTRIGGGIGRAVSPDTEPE